MNYQEALNHLFAFNRNNSTVGKLIDIEAENCRDLLQQLID